MGTIPDNLEGIFQHLREAALTMQKGGGVGMDFSTIRPAGAPVRGVGAQASGPLSFMDAWDAMCRTVMSAGQRRGAMMACLRIDHPDVLEFVSAKADPGRLRNFNVSVAVTDEFMRAVEAGRDYGLVSPRTGAEVKRLDAPHDWEHSLEVQLPFLQRVLGGFRLVPISVGDATPDEVAEVLELLWGGRETLVVVSSDLSHYYDYETARRLDARTTLAIEALEPGGLDEESACGRVPARGLLVAAKRHALRARTLDLRSSGDTAGSRDEVVGYAKLALSSARPDVVMHDVTGVRRAWRGRGIAGARYWTRSATPPGPRTGKTAPKRP